jgi:predicted 3-demethylubiquinone-9 3-methyltransferase (glyoxalase superfamily)
MSTTQTSQNKLTPCLWCNNNALEKAEYYTSIFPNSKILSQQAVMVVFELDGVQFQAINGGMDFGYNESISWVIDCQDQAEVDHYWDSFVKDGGKESQCGWCADKYGMFWQIVPKQLGQLMMDEDREKAGKVMHAMLKMQKIIVADLEKAYNS